MYTSSNLCNRPAVSASLRQIILLSCNGFQWCMRGLTEKPSHWWLVGYLAANYDQGKCGNTCQFCLHYLCIKVPNQGMWSCHSQTVRPYCCVVGVHNLIWCPQHSQLWPWLLAAYWYVPCIALNSIWLSRKSFPAARKCHPVSTGVCSVLHLIIFDSVVEALQQQGKMSSNISYHIWQPLEALERCGGWDSRLKHPLISHILFTFII